MSDTILVGLDKLQTHHKVVLDQGEIDIFIDRLRHYTPFQVETALSRCLDEVQFMPKLPEVKARIPEQKWPNENPGRFVLNGPPILDEVRAIVRELCATYDQLDVTNPQDRQLIHDLFAQAARERYRRMGLNPDKWKAGKST